MAKHKQPTGATEVQEEPKEVTGTSRIIKSGKPFLPDPILEVRKSEPAKAAKEKNTIDPHKPVQVEVGAQHLMRSFARTTADNRTTRLVELARTDNDVKWLLAEYQKNTETKS